METKQNKLIAKYELANGGKVLVVSTTMHNIEICALIVVDMTGLIVAQGVFMSDLQAKTVALSNLKEFAAGDYSALTNSLKLVFG